MAQDVLLNQCTADRSHDEDDAHAIVLKLRIPCHTWHSGDRVELVLSFTNVSTAPLVVRLGSHVGGTDATAVLAAVGLQSERPNSPTDGTLQWLSARVLEPRGAQIRRRERALYLPPSRGARLTLVGGVIVVGGVGCALRFGGGAVQDASEVLLPLLTRPVPTVAPLSPHSSPGFSAQDDTSDDQELEVTRPRERQRLRFELRGVGGPVRESGCVNDLHWDWVGPYSPHPAEKVQVWHGTVTSAPCRITLNSRPAARTPKASNTNEEFFESQPPTPCSIGAAHGFSPSSSHTRRLWAAEVHESPLQSPRRSPKHADQTDLLAASQTPAGSTNGGILRLPTIEACEGQSGGHVLVGRV